MGRKWFTTVSVVLIYVVASGLVLAFAQGYSVDLKTETVITTGVIDIATFPSQADVTIDDQVLSDKTPVSLPRYLPGEYVVDISKLGYQPIRARATVQSQIVTRFKEVALWPKNDNWQSINFDNTVVSVEAIVPTGVIMVQTEKEISWWQPQNKQMGKILALPITTTESIMCSTDGVACLVVGPDRSVLVDLISKTYQVLKAIPNTGAIRQFFRFQNEYFLLMQENHQIALQKLSPTGELVLQMSLSDIDAYALQGQEIWYVRTGVLYHRSLISGLTQVVTAMNSGLVVDKLLVSARFILWHTVDNQVALWDRNSEIIENTWSDANIFGDQEQFLVVSQAKIWSISPAQRTQFIGQAPTSILTAHSYTNYSWYLTLADGRMLIALTSPICLYIADVDTHAVSVLPYQAIVKWHDQVMEYHLYPARNWLSLNT